MSYHQNFYGLPHIFGHTQLKGAEIEIAACQASAGSKSAEILFPVTSIKGKRSNTELMTS
jgi:hypothetical protein